MVQENKHLHVSCDEDEIDLRELFQTIKKYIKQIGIFVIATTSITLLYVLSLPNTYTSATILAPQSQTKSSL